MIDVDDATLGGYLARHDRPPAFGGSDGKPYSVGLWVDEEPAGDGMFDGVLLFVRWSDVGDAPVGHLQSGVVARGRTVAETDAALRSLRLHTVKALLDEAIATAEARPDW